MTKRLRVGDKAWIRGPGAWEPVVVVKVVSRLRPAYRVRSIKRRKHETSEKREWVIDGLLLSEHAGSSDKFTLGAGARTQGPEKATGAHEQLPDDDDGAEPTEDALDEQATD